MKKNKNSTGENFLRINFLCDKILDMGDANMAIEQEASTRASPKDISTKPNKEIAAAKPNFAHRIRELKISSQAASAKITQLLYPEAQQEKTQKSTTPEDVLNKLEILGKEESLSPYEFVIRSREILQASTTLINLALAQKKKLEQQANPLQADIKTGIDPKIEALNRTKGIRKFLVRGERDRLATQKSNIQSQLAELDRQIQTKKQLMGQIVAQEQPVRQKQEEALMIAVGQEIETIRSGYEQLLQEILKDGTVLADIRETYIEKIITPAVNEIADPHTEGDRKNEFYQALRTYLDHGEEPDIWKSDHQKLLNSFGYQDVPYLAGFLLGGNDKKIIKSLIAKIAMQDIAPIRTAAESKWKIYPSNNNYWKIFEKALGPMAHSSDIKDSFGQEIMDQDYESTYGVAFFKYRYIISLWQVADLNQDISD